MLALMGTGGEADKRFGRIPSQFTLSVGLAVEYASDEDGGRGSLYRATVTALRDSTVTIQLRDLVDDNGAGAVMQVRAGQLRPLPPPTPTDFFLRRFKEGQVLDLSHLDGYWRVKLMKRANGKFEVVAPLYDAKHRVKENKLRPAWHFTRGGWTILR